MLKASVNTSFCRSFLAEVLKDVRSLKAGVKVQDAWVWKVGKDHWEFHYGDFYWHGSADNAYAARANGWAAWLRKQGVAE